MQTISVHQPINLKVVRFELDFSDLVNENEKPRSEKRTKKIRIPKINNKKQSPIPPAPFIKNSTQVRNCYSKVIEK